MVQEAGSLAPRAAGAHLMPSGASNFISYVCRYDTMQSYLLQMMRGKPSGRLLRWSAADGRTHVLTEGLWCNFLSARAAAATTATAWIGSSWQLMHVLLPRWLLHAPSLPVCTGHLPACSRRFANGVALSEDQSFVLVAESSGMRVHQVHLTGEKVRGSRDTLGISEQGRRSVAASDGAGQSDHSSLVLSAVPDPGWALPCLFPLHPCTLPTPGWHPRSLH